MNKQDKEAYNLKLAQKEAEKKAAREKAEQEQVTEDKKKESN